MRLPSRRDSSSILEYWSSMIVIDYICDREGSDEVAAGGLLFLLDHGLHLLLQDHAHGLVEDGLEALLRERAALHVLAFELVLDDLPCGFLHDGGVLGVFFHHGELVPQIDLVAHEDLRHVPDVLLQFGIPLYRVLGTFLRALTKEEGSMTEKTMRKTSQLG